MVPLQRMINCLHHAVTTCLRFIIILLCSPTLQYLLAWIQFVRLFYLVISIDNAFAMNRHSIELLIPVCTSQAAHITLRRLTV